MTTEWMPLPVPPGELIGNTGEFESGSSDSLPCPPH